MRRIFKFDNIQGNSLTHNKELNILVYEFSFGSSHVGVNYTRNSSGDEIANVNFFYDDIVHALQNTIDS